MAVLFLESSGQYHGGNVSASGIWASVGGSNPGVSSAAPAGRSSTWAYIGNTGNVQPVTNLLPGSPSTLFSGHAVYVVSAVSGWTIAFFRLLGAEQCSVRVNASGQLFFTRNGTTIGSTSTQALTTGWHYFEFKAIAGLSSNGTCEVRVDGNV